MRCVDLSLREFVDLLVGRGLSPFDVARLLTEIEKYGNSREAYWLEPEYEQHFSSDDRIFYTEAEADGQGHEITGFILYPKIDPEVEVTHWAVKYKGCGEGGAVLARFLSQIGSRAYKVILECGEWNERAIKLYEAFHFEKVAFRPAYYRSGEGAWILERKAT